MYVFIFATVSVLRQNPPLNESRAHTTCTGYYYDVTTLSRGI